jgi:hypothetical protein
MKRIEQFKKLLEVQDSIGGAIDLVSPTRYRNRKEPQHF